MTFTKELPTRPGFYAWRVSEGFMPELVQVVIKEERIFTGWNGSALVSKKGGEWCELVPKDEVAPKEEIERAWNEGFEWTFYTPVNKPIAWHDSRAKRVMEGRE